MSYQPIDPSVAARAAGGLAPVAPTRPASTSGGASFGDALKKATGASDVKFSGHALQRIQRRQLDVGPATLERLSDGISKAAAKGSRSSVVLVDDAAFVVAVPSKTVITAVGRDQMKDQVFTNIDSAVFA